MKRLKKVLSYTQTKIYLVSIFLFMLGLFLSKIHLVSFKYSGVITLIFLFLSALPVYYGLFKTISYKHAFYSIFTLSIISLMIEYIGLTTGFPYGDFYYTSLAGFKIFDILPISIAFAWPLLVIGSYFLFIDDENKVTRDIKPVLFIIALDLVIDPAAVEFGLWGWLEGGLYYNVPLVNYFGWFISATIGLWILKKIAPAPKEVESISPWLFFSVFLNLTFWSGFLLGSKFYIPFIISLFLFYKLINKADLHRIGNN